MKTDCLKFNSMWLKAVGIRISQIARGDTGKQADT